MRYVLPTSIFAGLVLLTTGGCSGGSSGSSSSTVRIRCINGDAFCIISCDLGCTQTGCSVTEIAENQRLSFRFSEPVVRSSVTTGSISIRTASGVTPDGFFEFSESDTVVTFVPRVTTSGGVSTFGFQRGESYILTIAGGSSSAFGVKSLSGATLSKEVNCTVVASRGIIDEDQQPPTATLVTPTAGSNTAPRNPTIVLRFSELIDTTALQSPLSIASPIRVVLRGTRLDGTCDRDAEGIALEGLAQLSTETVGTREVTVVTYQPPVQLPGQSCVTVYVTGELRDLSGRSATPAQFEFLTVAGTPTPITITEAFANNAHQVEQVSSGTWSGGARPGLLGGDGRHGSFTPTLGVAAGNGVYVWNTDSFTIPGTNTPDGLPVTVSDGKFYFTDFVLPAGTTVRFTGSIAPQIYVRGRTEIQGTIQVNGTDLPFGLPTQGTALGQKVSNYNYRSGTTTAKAGQPGTSGGPGGGAGGKGGDKCQNTGPLPGNACDGAAGQDLRVPAGHAYAGSVLGTGGAGSPLTPAAGTATAAATPVLGSLYRGQFSRGGRGGSFQVSGALPVGPTTPVGIVVSAAPTSGNVITVSDPPVGTSSLDHYMIGGSGGGGGGSHTFGLLSIGANLDFYMAGAGGSGGGGTFAIRSGGDILVTNTGQLQSKGGLGVLICGDDPATTVQEALSQTTCPGVASPGGGGSGGSMLLQSGRNLTVQGLIDTSGGTGSRVGFISPSTVNATAQAGNGAPGFYRLEANGSVALTATGSLAPIPAQTPANSGALLDRDARAGDLSTWYGTNLIFPPTWLRYELDVDTDGNGTVDTTYTDSGVAGTVRANDPAGPVTIQFQGATLNQSGTAPLPGTPIKQWRDGIGSGAGPGISQDSVTGFRFQLIWNRAAFPNAVIQQLRVYAQS